MQVSGLNCINSHGLYADLSPLGPLPLHCARAILISPSVQGSTANPAARKSLQNHPVHPLSLFPLCSILTLSTDEGGEDPCCSSSLSPPLSPSPPPSPLISSDQCCKTPQASCVIGSSCTQNQHPPSEVKLASSEEKSPIRQTSNSPDDNEPKKLQEQRKVVSPACYFCRRRRVAHQKLPEGSPSWESSLDLNCE